MGDLDWAQPVAWLLVWLTGVAVTAFESLARYRAGRGDSPVDPLLGQMYILGKALAWPLVVVLMGCDLLIDMRAKSIKRKGVRR